MDGLGYKAVGVLAPEIRTKKTPDGSANTVSSVRLYSVTTLSQSSVLPDGWDHKYLHISAEGADLYYFFTDDPGQTVDKTVTGTADGTSSDGTKLGGVILAGQSRDVFVSQRFPGGNGKIYFVRQGSAAGNARVELSSE